MYQDIKTGIQLKRVSEWKIMNGIDTAHFKTDNGISFILSITEVRIL